jgi:glycosyltransferase involved in cell wall biosynthesis
MKISIIIPAKNEEANIYRLISEIPIAVYEIIVIDGNSVDETFNIAKSHPKCTKVIKQIAKGKGAALSRGFAECVGDIVITLDADGSTDPREIPSFIDEIILGNHLVKGSRKIPNGGSEDLTLFRDLGNLFLTSVANMLFKTNWSDLAYGYIAITKDLLSELKINNFDETYSSKLKYGQGFEIESLICCRTAKLGYQIKEVPSFERRRWSGSSNLKSIPDGIRALISILRESRKG